MALTIILICLVIQRWWGVDHFARSYRWLDVYFDWIQERFNRFAWWSGMGGAIVSIAPVFIIYILFAGLIYHLLGIIAYYLLALVVLWYAMDARCLIESATSVDARQILIDAYQRIFALIFWLVLLGSSGVVLYVLTVCLHHRLGGDERSQKLLGILDWIPLRLMGLTYALVGHFSPTFKCWYPMLFTGIRHSREQTIECSMIALGEEEKQLPVMETWINRCLWIWLVVIALVTIGRWIG